MRKNIFYYLLFIIFLICSSVQSQAQVYSINNGFTNNQTVTTCSGTFYDSNVSGNYGTSENYVVTFSPGNPGRIMQFDFVELNIGTGDTLFVFDGAGVLNNVIDTFTNVSYNYAQAIFASDTNSVGSLTFRFKSDGSGQASGWKANLKCGFPCKQRILGNINTSPAKDANNFTNICLTTSGLVMFDITTAYPDNGTIYNQADTSSYFHWFFGDGKDSVRKNLSTISHIYNQEGGYNVRLIITDSNGCVNRLPIIAKVRTGIKPLFKITAPANLCVGDTAKLTPSATVPTSGTGGFAAPLAGSFVTLPVSGDSLFLPDGSGVTYTSNIFINQFAAGQTLTSINDFKGVFINMEHSYLGDLNISLTSPNGVTVNLKTYPGGADCYLGEPVDEDYPPPANNSLSNIAGKGYTYSFSASPTYGTMVSEALNYTHTYVDNAGRTITHKYLPAGSYLPVASLSAFVGTPLNGTWTLKIKDNLAIDNGFLFNWKIEFNPAIFPNIETYNVPIVSQKWITPANGLVNVNGTIATILPDISGSLNYLYRVTDGFGCVFDTTIKIQAVAAPVKPNLGADVALCNGQTSLTLTVSNPDNTAFYTWNNGSSGVATFVSTPGLYIVDANNSDGCKSKDSIVVSPPEVVTVNLGNDTSFCASKHNLLKPVVSSNVIKYLWNDGSIKDTLRISAPGTYSVTGTTANGCTALDQIIVNDNPVNSFSMPVDTTICDKSSYVVTLSVPNNTSVLWNDGFTGKTKTVYSNTAYSVTANNIGCLKQSSYKVWSKPLPVVNIGRDTTVCNSKILLLNAHYPGATYLWNNNSTDSFLLAAAQKIYWVEATFNQCKFRDSLDLKYKKCDCNTIVPNAFSPNNDFINDFFIPKMECVPAEYHLTIFNRYGQQIFETKDYTKSWNGMLNGKALPVATYYYILTYYNTGLQIHERFTGGITILR